jgi:polyphosphate kinase
MRYYSFLATGNLNEVTARFYTDHAFFTTNNEIGAELQSLFDYLQSRKQPAEFGKITFKHLLVSQFNLIDRFSQLIDREIANAKAGKEARIIIKLNNLQEKEMISRLYDASREGVKVQLLVRSICCLAPGVKEQSENITVHRIVDRYLEHARVFMFHNDGNPEYYMGSADWMNRNLHSRIEVCFPVAEPKLAQELGRILELQLNDNSKAVLINTELDNPRVSATSYGDVPTAAQRSIYDYVKTLNR